MIELYDTSFFQHQRIKPLIIQVGLGGTGSNCAQQIAQMLSMTESGFYVLADPDVVEEKNLKNQLFSHNNVGQTKAEILANRYRAAYQFPIYAYTDQYIENIIQLNDVFSYPFMENSFHTKIFPILIGCVDNNYSRQLFHDFFYHEQVENLIYIDAGNESVRVPNDFPTRPMNEWTKDEHQSYRESGWSGQVVCGVKKRGKVLLEPVADVYPDILEDTDEIAPSKLSCEELSSSDPQRLITNRYAAMSISSYVAEIIDSGTISNHRTVFHAKRGYMRSEPAEVK